MPNDFKDSYEDDGFRSLKISKKEFKELREYFEMSDVEVIERAVKILYDILRSEQLGWKFSVVKIKKNGDKEIFDTDYAPNILPIGLNQLYEPNSRINFEDFERLKKDKWSKETE